MKDDLLIKLAREQAVLYNLSDQKYIDTESCGNISENIITDATDTGSTDAVSSQICVKTGYLKIYFNSNYELFLIQSFIYTFFSYQLYNF